MCIEWRGGGGGLRDGTSACINCMYACINICMYVCMYVCIYVCIYIYVWWKGDIKRQTQRERHTSTQQMTQMKCHKLKFIHLYCIRKDEKIILTQKIEKILPTEKI